MCSFNKLILVTSNKSICIITVLEERCLKPSSVTKYLQDLALLNTLGENLFLCLFQLLEASFIPSLLPFLTPQSQQQCVSLLILPDSADRKGYMPLRTCDWFGPFAVFGSGYLWRSLFCLSYIPKL